MELQSGNTHFGSKLAIFVSCHLEIRNWNWILSLEMINSGQNRWFLGPCDLENWWLILKINRAPLLCPSRLCALFHNHQWIQTEVTAWKHPIWVKIVNFLSSVTLKFDGWPWKIKGHLYYVTSSSVHHFTAIGQFKLELQSGNTQFGS